MSDDRMMWGPVEVYRRGMTFLVPEYDVRRYGWPRGLSKVGRYASIHAWVCAPTFAAWLFRFLFGVEWRIREAIWWLTPQGLARQKG